MLDDTYCVQEAGGFHSYCRARERDMNIEKVLKNATKISFLTKNQ